MTELGGSEGGGFHGQNPTLSYREEKGGATQVKGVGQECPTHTGKKNPYPLLKSGEG